MPEAIDKSKAKIESMFDEIAPTYDRLNHILTLNIDKKWRKEIVRYISGKKIPYSNILDVASGTGDLSAELLKLNALNVTAVDISKKMLDIQREKISSDKLTLIQADASRMPFEDNWFDIVTIGFGARNFEDLDSSFKEISRVMKPGGMLVILEMFRTGGLKRKVFNLYFGSIMPYIGNKISGSNFAYSYLFRSVDNFFSAGEFITALSDKFEVTYLRNNFLGIVNTIYFVKK